MMILSRKKLWNLWKLLLISITGKEKSISQLLKDLCKKGKKRIRF